MASENESTYTSHQSTVWSKNRDSQKCAACELDFIKGDIVYRDVALTIHATVP